MPTTTSSLLICDLTQSYSPRGGGVSTYLREKREHILARTDHRLLQIVPGPENRIIENGRSIWAEVRGEPVRGSPHYRFILRTGAVRDVLDRYAPDVIESLCPWLLPWTAINYRRANPHCTLVAGYHTDFPNAQIHRVGNELFGATVASGLRRLSASYAGLTYREFDRVYTLGQGMCRVLAGYGIDHVDVLDLGVDTRLFDPARRDPAYRRKLGFQGEGPLLIYAGRLDNERRADLLIEMMRLLPRSLDAMLLLLGEGKLRDGILDQSRGLAVAAPGFVADRGALATALASADIYVSGMPSETFGIAVAEAQASGLPVVGIASGAMIERVPEGLGLLGPAGDAQTMARNVEAVWANGREAMGRAAREHILERFSWERTFDRLLTEVYSTALARSKRRLAERRSWMSLNRAAGSP